MKYRPDIGGLRALAIIPVVLYHATISLDLNTINSKLREITGSNSFIDPSEFFCPMQKCRFKSTKNFYF